MGNFRGFRLHHHPDQGLGAGGTDENAALAAQLFLLSGRVSCRRDSSAMMCLLDSGGVGDLHVDELLGILGAAGGQLGGGDAAAAEGLQKLQGRQLAVAGGGIRPEDGVARLLAADGDSRRPASAPAHGGRPRRCTPGPCRCSWQILMQAQVGHDGGHHGVAGAASPGASCSEAQTAMTLSPSMAFPCSSTSQAAVGVAVEGDAQIIARRLTTRRARCSRWVEPQPLLMLTPSGSVWMKSAWSPEAAGTGPAQWRRPRRWRSPPASAGRPGRSRCVPSQVAGYSRSAGRAYRGGGGPSAPSTAAGGSAWFRISVLDPLLHLVGELVALAVEDLDAVVLIGVVGGGDDDAGVRLAAHRQIGHRRGGDDAQGHHVAAHGAQTRHQGRLQHIGGDAGVLADE